MNLYEFYPSKKYRPRRNHANFRGNHAISPHNHANLNKNRANSSHNRANSKTIAKEQPPSNSS